MRLALLRPAWTARPAAYPRNPVWMRSGSSSHAHRLPLVALDAGFSRPRRTWAKPGPEREATLTWLVPAGHPAPAYATPSASWGPRWPYCAVVPLASPTVRRRMGRGHIWKQTPPHPISSLGNSLLGGFLTPLPIFFFFFLVFNDPRTEAWRAAFTGERC